MKTQLGITLQNLVDQMFHFLRGEGVKVPILGGEPTHTLYYKTIKRIKLK